MEPGRPKARTAVEPTALELPVSATPRPGERIVCYRGDALVSGRLLGHGADGRPRMITDFETPFTPADFRSIRRETPLAPLSPNWMRLPETALVVRTTDAERQEFARLLVQRTPPGPQYLELVGEIWSRGYEVFVVGGTVRDVLAGIRANDVDLVTTMPLEFAQPLVKQMYRFPANLEPTAREHGHLRFGGKFGSADPYVDLSVFKDRFIGTNDALFGADFGDDVGNRDFACNAVYYDPINDVLIDPSGTGIADAEQKVLRLVCDVKRRVAYQQAQVAIRYFKFVERGFLPGTGCGPQIASVFIPALGAMPEAYRIKYVQKQLRLTGDGNADAAIQRLEEQFAAIGAEQAWRTYVEPIRAELAL
jgi:hypothetical protein